VLCKQVCADCAAAEVDLSAVEYAQDLGQGPFVELGRFHLAEKCSSVTVWKLSSLLQRVSIGGLLSQSHTSIIISSVLLEAEVRNTKMLQ
jgi:hypothetical protein